MKRLVRDPWFQSKRFGWGLSPARWEGWATIAVLFALLYATLVLTRPLGQGFRAVAVALAALEVLAFIALTVLTSVWLEPR